VPRTTPELVGQLVELDPSIEPAPFIDLAAELVTEFCVAPFVVAGVTVTPSDVRLEMIERNLAAHFYACLRDKQVSSEAIGGAITTAYQSKIDLGLSLTHYGQTAMGLDSSGRLAAHNARTLKPAGGGYVPIVGGINLGRDAYRWGRRVV
jgi:hypothetical protein